MLTEILRLKAEQKKMRDAKWQLSKDLRNAERRRSRLKKRAKLLSDSDLAAVMALRAQEKAMAATKGKIEASAEDDSSMSSIETENSGARSSTGS